MNLNLILLVLKLTMNELLKSIRAALYDRITSPLLSTFTIAWLAWNHRLIFVLFSSMKTHEKFIYIDTMLYQNWGEPLYSLIIFPSISTFLFQYFYPFPARLAFEYWREKKKELREIRQGIENDELLSREKSIELRNHGYIMKLDFDKQLESIEEELKDKNILIKTISTENDELKLELQKIKRSQPISRDKLITLSDKELETIAAEVLEEFNDNDLIILGLLTNALNMGKQVSFNYLKRSSDFENLELNVILDKLRDKDFVQEIHDDTSDTNEYVLTSKGKKYCLEHNINSNL